MTFATVVAVWNVFALVGGVTVSVCLRWADSADREGVTGRDGEARSVHPSGPAGCAPCRGPAMPGWPPSESPAA